jgi:hypothetical protein
MRRAAKWLLKWSGEIAKFAFVVLVVGNLALGLGGYLQFSSIEVAQAWGGNTLGFAGAFLGAYAAIWWAWRERNRTERRKWQAIGSALYYEMSFNLIQLERLQVSPLSTSIAFSSASFDSFTQHLDLFSGIVYYKVQIYRSQLINLEELLGSRALVPERIYLIDNSHHQGKPELEVEIRAQANRVQAAAESARKELDKSGAVVHSVIEGRATVMIGIGVQGSGIVGP